VRGFPVRRSASTGTPKASLTGSTDGASDSAAPPDGRSLLSERAGAFLLVLAP
jgi:hypothetical protein